MIFTEKYLNNNRLSDELRTAKRGNAPRNNLKTPENMKTIEKYNGQRFEIDTYFSQTLRGRGGWNINCEVSFKGEKKTFRHYTTDSMFIDQISDMKADHASWDEIQKAYKEKAFDSIEPDILEWCEDINEKEEENAK